MLNSGNSGFPHAGHMFGKWIFSSTFLISFLRLLKSVFIFSKPSFSG